ncbi:MAG: 2-hydroxyacyl-CoA dehydratase family protein [Actinomycetota bacterium]|nr:2-hydroxyacyl-CoA dehydratase family protein [Actinomycetota bacterium]
MGNEISKTREAAANPTEYAREWKKRTGRPVIGYFCSYAPVEMIHAAGALPFRITGGDREIARSGAHLQQYCCSLARTALEGGLSGELDFLDGTIFTHTCDTMQRLSDIWRRELGLPFHADFILPVRFSCELAFKYMLEELKDLRSKLELFLGEVSNENLRGSIEIYNKNRKLLSELYDMRVASPALVSCRDSLMCVYSSMIMDVDENNAFLGKALEDLRSKEGNESCADDYGNVGKIPLFGSGSVMNDWEVLRILEEAGGTIVDDDFCTGRRYFEGCVSPEGEPMLSIVKRIWERDICPCKHRLLDERAKRLVLQMERSRANGVLFFLLKFCDPHFFDFPYVVRALENRGVPSLLLEMEQGSVSIENIRTRIEAFMETMRECH